MPAIYYPKELYEQALKLRKEKLSYAKIGKIIGVAGSTVRNWCLGLKKPYGVFTEEEILAINKKKSEAKKGKLNPNYGKTMSDEQKKKTSKSLTGKKHTKEAKQRMSLSKIGVKNPRWKGDNTSQEAGRKRARRRYKAPEGKQIHHIDGNALNNDPSNIQFVTPKEHVHIDGRIEDLIELSKTPESRERVRQNAFKRWAKWKKERHQPEPKNLSS